MFYARPRKPLIAVAAGLLLFAGPGQAEIVGLSHALAEMIQKCFKDPQGGYADKKVTGLHEWMTNLQGPTTQAQVANEMELSGFIGYKFKWKLIDNPKNEWHDDLAIFYILVQHGQLKFSKGLKPAKCEYVKVLNPQKAEPPKKSVDLDELFKPQRN